MRYIVTIAAIVAGFVAPDNWAREPRALLGLPPRAVALAGAQTPEIVDLGRRLFFEATLSANGQVSCATCHQPDKAFSDGQPLAMGIHGRTGTRNTPTVINAALHGTQFWDGRRGSLEEQAADPFVNPAEHGLPDHEAVLALLRSDGAYRGQFEIAFGAGRMQITMDEVTKALAAFIRSLSAGDSAFDRYAYAGDSAALDAPARQGLELFQGRAQCVDCHTISEQHAAFTDGQFHSIGVGLERIASKLGPLATRVARTSPQELDELVISDPDVAALGRFVVTRNPADIGKFRTPTLRNVALTAPYMHDGSVATLEAALEHELYYRGQAQGRPIILTPAEKAALVAFLKSLTSTTLPH